MNITLEKNKPANIYDIVSIASDKNPLSPTLCHILYTTNGKKPCEITKKIAYQLKLFLLKFNADYFAYYFFFLPSTLLDFFD